MRIPCWKCGLERAYAGQHDAVSPEVGTAEPARARRDERAGTPAAQRGRDAGVAGLPGVRVRRRRGQPRGGTAGGTRSLRVLPRRADHVQAEHPLHQHHRRRGAARVPRRPRDRTPHPQHYPLERRRDGHQGEQEQRRDRRAPQHVRQRRRAAGGGLQPLLPRPRRRAGPRPDLLPGPRQPRRVRPLLPGGPFRRGPHEPLPPRTATRRRGPEQLPAPVADARLLGVPDRQHGPGPHPGDLPGALHQVP